MSTPEAKVKVRVKKLLAEFNAYFTMPAGTGFGRSGVPDFLICYKGQFIAVECKAGDNKPTALQLRELKAIEDTGGMTLVINEDNLDRLRELLEMTK